MAIAIEMEVEGIAELEQGLALVRQRLNVNGDTFNKAMNKGMLRMRAAMAEYPPPRPGSPYVRTYRLQKNWKSRVTIEGDTLIGRVTNTTPYMPYVQMEEWQARMHRGRWQTEADVLGQNEDRIVGEFEGLVDEIVKEFDA